MIYHERIWKDDSLSVTEIVPLDGQELPLDFKPFRLRLTVRTMHPRLGPQQHDKEVVLLSGSAADAFAEARGVAPQAMKDLTDEFKTKLQKAERQIIAPTNGNHRKEALARM